MIKNQIILTGLATSGKGTQGKILSKELGILHIDEDDFFEEKYGPVRNLIKIEGRKKYELKRKKVIEILSNVDNVVISTGGGTGINNNLSIYNGLKFFLNITPENFLKRIKKSKKEFGESPENLRRAAFYKTDEEILKIGYERYEKYKFFSDFEINGNPSVEKVTFEILKILKNLGHN